MANRHWEQNKEATVYVGNLDERFNDPLMWELMTQMGPVVNVHMPMDRVSRIHQGFGFVEFDTPESAEYASRVLNGIRVFGKPLRVNKASADRARTVGNSGGEIGAELFINNLDPQVDEKLLHTAFMAFGKLVRAPSVVRDMNNVSKGYGFVSFDSFESSDEAIREMDGQYLLSKQIAVEYAYKKDGKGERHGDEAERKLAAEARKHNVAPEIQPLPPAFYMTARPPVLGAAALPPGPLPGAPGAPVGPGVSGVPVPGAGPISAGGMPPTNGSSSAYPPAMSQSSQMPSRGGPPTHPASSSMPPPGFHPQQHSHAPRFHNLHLQQPQQQPPSLPAGFGRGGGMGPPPTQSSLPTPNGLPARPPSGSANGGPPGFGRPPPPGFATGANGMGMAPPGSAPPAGFNGMPPPPPPGFTARR